MDVRFEIANFLSRLPSRRIVIELGDLSYLKLFDSEIAFINFIRLRYFSYFGILFSIFLLYTDFYLEGFWSDFEINNYIILDFIYALVAIVILLSTHIIAPKSHEHIKFSHRLIVFLSLVYFVCWSRCCIFN